MLRMRPKCLLFRATVVVARGDDLRFRRVQACVVEGAWNHSKFLEVVKVGVVTEVAVVCRGGGCCWCCLQPLLAATAAAVPVDTSSDCGSLLLLVVLKVSCQGRQKNLTGLWSQCSHTWCSSMFVASPVTAAVLSTSSASLPSSSASSVSSFPSSSSLVVARPRNLKHRQGPRASVRDVLRRRAILESQGLPRNINE